MHQQNNVSLPASPYCITNEPRSAGRYRQPQLGIGGLRAKSVLQIAAECWPESRAAGRIAAPPSGTEEKTWIGPGLHRQSPGGANLQPPPQDLIQKTVLQFCA